MKADLCVPGRRVMTVSYIRQPGGFIRLPSDRVIAEHVFLLSGLKFPVVRYPLPFFPDESLHRERPVRFLSQACAMLKKDSMPPIRPDMSFIFRGNGVSH